MQDRRPKVFAVGGGKGGVGKSMVSCNLAIQYAQAGLKTALLDLDFGAANVHTLLGQHDSQKSLAEYFLTPNANLIDYIVPTATPNLQVGVGSGFVYDLANIKPAQKQRLLDDIAKLDCDLVILDLGAGTASNVIDFFSAVETGIVVTTPEPTSIINAYEFLKNVVFRILTRLFKKQAEISKILDAARLDNNSLGIHTVSDFVEVVRKTKPWLAQNVEEVVKNIQLFVVFNQARKLSEAQMGVRLREICKKHLCIDLNYPGMVFHSADVLASVHKRQPVSLSFPDSVTAKSLERIAERILRRVVGQDTASSETQLLHTIAQAKADFEAHILMQRQYERKRLAEIGQFEQEEQQELRL